jgi:hypothetical protein
MDKTSRAIAVEHTFVAVLYTIKSQMCIFLFIYKNETKNFVKVPNQKEEKLKFSFSLTCFSWKIDSFLLFSRLMRTTFFRDSSFSAAASSCSSLSAFCCLIY